MNLERLPVLSLAPMAGITDWPLRVLCYRMGAEYACSEMVSAIGYLCAKPGNRVYTQLLQVHPEETNTACQLFGKDPVVMGEAAQKDHRAGPVPLAGYQHGLSRPEGGLHRRGQRPSAEPESGLQGDGGRGESYHPARHLQDPAGLRPAIHERRGAGQGRPVAGASVDVRPRPHPGAAVLRTGRLRRHRPGAGAAFHPCDRQRRRIRPRRRAAHPAGDRLLPA